MPLNQLILFFICFKEFTNTNNYKEINLWNNIIKLSLV